MKNAEAQLLLVALTSREFEGVKLPGKISYAVARSVAKLQDNQKTVEEQRTKLLKEHCNLDEKGEPNVIEVEENGQTAKVYDVKDKEAYLKALDELMGADADVELFKFDGELLEGADGLTLNQTSILLELSK